MKTRNMQPAQLLQAIMMCIEDSKKAQGHAEDAGNDFLDENEIEDLDELLSEYNKGKGNPPLPKTKIKPTAKDNNELSQHIEQLQKQSGLLAYELSKNDVLVIACIWRKMLRGRGSWRCLDWEDVLAWCKLDNTDVTGNLEYLATLLDRNIIFNQNDSVQDYHLNLFSLVDGNYMLHSNICYALTRKTPIRHIDETMAKVWATKAELEADLLRSRKMLTIAYPELEEGKNEAICFHWSILEPWVGLFKSRLQACGTELALSRFVLRHQPQDRELALLLWVYADTLMQTATSSYMVINMVSRNYAERISNLSYLTDNARLKDIGIYETRSGAFYRSSVHIELNKKALAELELKKHAEGFEDEDEDIDDTFVELTAHQSFDNLILPAEDKELLEDAIKRYQASDNTSLADWGITLAQSSGKEPTVKGTCFLLYGAPGTGKTFSAGAIANALGRKLYAIDASKLRDKYYGASEKILRNAFATMRTMINDSEIAPVFLLNEADQIVHKRQNLDHSCSSVENALQNIFLEELESFPGILILTTNLVENIDEAYFRRFDIKIELHCPDYDCRVKLWKLHIPPTIPGAEEIDCEYLAQAYALSGGQIRLVVSNACSKAISREGEEKRLRLEDLIRYAKLEDPWTNKQEKKIGFGA